MNELVFLYCFLENETKRQMVNWANQMVPNLEGGYRLNSQNEVLDRLVERRGV